MRTTKLWLALVALALWAPRAALAEPLPGLLDTHAIEEGRAEAAAQKQAAQDMVRTHARTLGYSDKDIDRALAPTMVRTGTFRVSLSDGTEVEFPWHRIGFAQNRIANAGKPSLLANREAMRAETNKGGVRLHHGVFADEVEALALKMDTKLAITQDALEGHAFRGAKGGIGAGRVVKVGTRYAAKVGDYVDPAAPVFDRPAIMEKFAASFRASGGDVGPGLDVQAGDVNTKAPEMKALAIAYGKGRPSPGVSGKEVLTLPSGEIDPEGGIAYRSRSTGEGVWAAARLAARRAGTGLKGATVMAQGWGEVGRAFGLAAARDGAVVVGVEDLWIVGGKKVAGTLRAPYGAGAKPAEVRKFLADVDAARASGQDLSTWQGGRLVGHFTPGLGAHAVKADIVGVNALGDVLSAETVPGYLASGTHQGKRKIIVEGANLAETTAGARLLDQHSAELLVVPGDLANIGGVHVSNLEAAQNRFGQAVSDRKARGSLLAAMRAGWNRALAIADQRGVSERAAVELSAVDGMMKRALDHKDAPRVSVERRVIAKPSRLPVGRLK